MNIDWFTFIAQVLNFVVLVYLLNYFLYGPITNAMKTRERSIADRLTDADRRENEAANTLQEYQKLTNEIEERRTSLLEEARRESELVRKKLLIDARAEVEQVRKEWIESLANEKTSLVRLFQQRSGQQIVKISRNALSQLADIELEKRTLELFVGKLEELSSNDIKNLKREFESTGRLNIHTAFPISKDWQTRIEHSLADVFGLQSVVFVTTPEIVCGVELRVGGTKIGWSVQEYLESLSDELGGMLEKQRVS